MNMPMRRNEPAKKERNGAPVACTAWVCSFGFKMLRVISVLLVQIATH